MDGKGNPQFCNDVIAGAPLLAALANALGRAQRESGLGPQQRQSGDRGTPRGRRVSRDRGTPGGFDRGSRDRGTPGGSRRRSRS